MFTAGQGFFLCEPNNEQTSIGKGTLIAIPPHILHTEKSNPHNPLHYYSVAFDELNIFGNRHSVAIFPCDKQYANYVQYLSEIYERAQNPAPFSENIVLNNFESFLILLTEALQTNFSDIPSINRQTPQELTQAIDYINSNYHLPITLEELASLSFLSKSQLNRLFQKYYSLSPGAYILRKRIDIAIYLLTFTECSVASVADAVGFNSVSNFIQKFREQVGETPKQFYERNRKKHAAF